MASNLHVRGSLVVVLVFLSAAAIDAKLSDVTVRHRRLQATSPSPKSSSPKLSPSPTPSPSPELSPSPAPSPMATPSPTLTTTNSTNGTSTNGTNTTAPVTAWDLISTSAEHTQLTMLLQMTNLSSLLMDHNLTATLLLPSDVAFILLFDEIGGNMTDLVKFNNGNYVKQLLLYHVDVSKVYSPADLQAAAKTGTFLDMANSLQVYLSLALSKDAMFSDLLGRSTSFDDLGAIGKSHAYSLNRVFIPEDAVTLNDLFDILQGHFSYFRQAMMANSDTGVLLRSFSAAVTVLAPFNQAWESYAEHVNMTVSQMLANASLAKAIVQSSIYPKEALTQANLLKSTKPYQMLYPSATFQAQYSEPNALVYLDGNGTVVDRQPFIIDPDLIAANSVVQGVDILIVPDDQGITYGPDYQSGDYQQSS